MQINEYPLGGVDTPFGGYKQSGLGREKGLAALEHYTPAQNSHRQRMTLGAHQ